MDIDEFELFFCYPDTLVIIKFTPVYYPLFCHVIPEGKPVVIYFQGIPLLVREFNFLPFHTTFLEEGNSYRECLPRLICIVDHHSKPVAFFVVPDPYG